MTGDEPQAPPVAAGSQPAGNQAVSEPAASEPAASEPAASEPAASEPAASDPTLPTRAREDADHEWGDWRDSRESNDEALLSNKPPHWS